MAHELSRHDGDDAVPESEADTSKASGSHDDVINQMREPLALALRNLRAVMLKRQGLVAVHPPEDETDLALTLLDDLTKNSDPQTDGDVTMLASDTRQTTHDFEQQEIQHLDAVMRQLMALAELIVQYSQPISGEHDDLQGVLSGHFSAMKPTGLASMVNLDGSFQPILADGLSSRGADLDNALKTGSVSRDSRHGQSYDDAFRAGEHPDGLDDSQQDGLHPLSDDNRTTDEG